MAAYAMRRIQRDIIAGALMPGQKLAFAPLIERYDVGLSPLREALCQLVGQGLVLLQSQRGFRVAPISQSDLWDVAAMRCYLEVHAFRLSIANGDAAWKKELDIATQALLSSRHHRTASELIDETWESIHRDFHFTLISACGSPILLQMCKQLYDRFDRYRRIAIHMHANMLSVADDHLRIRDAAVRGDTVFGATLLTDHLAAITDLVKNRYDESIAEYGTNSAVVQPIRSGDERSPIRHSAVP